MSAQTGDHWLWRLDSESWLRAAEAEIASGRRYTDLRRTALTHARRGVGMAVNALLVHLHDRALLSPTECESIWGRSYVEHIRLIGEANDDHPLLPTGLNERARALQQIPLSESQNLVVLHRKTESAAERGVRLAQEICEKIRLRIAESDVDKHSD
jgi:hypothetical protein